MLGNAACLTSAEQSIEESFQLTHHCAFICLPENCVQSPEMNNVQNPAYFILPEPGSALMLSGEIVIT